MPRLPGPEQLGGVPSMRSGRSAPNVGNLDTGAAEIAKGIGKVGSAAVGIAEERRQEDDVLDLAKADARLQQGLTELHREFETDPDHATYGPRFTESAEAVRSEAEGMIRNPRIRERWLPRAETSVVSTRDRVLARGTSLAREAKFDELDGVLATQRNTYLQAPDDAARERLRTTMDETIQLGTQSGLLTPDQARRLRRTHIDGAIEEDVDRQIWDNPYAVLQDLTQGDQRARSTAAGEVSEQGLAFLRRVEGFNSNAYADGRQTSIGYGTRGRPGETITREEADKRLRREAGAVSRWIKQNVSGELTQLQHDGLVSFGYNLGTDDLEKLKGDINRGDWETVSRRMRSFDGQVDDRTGQRTVLPGLTARRNEEADMVLGQATADRYSRLPPDRRRALINRTQVALRAVTQQELGDEVERIRRTGELVQDQSGMTVLDRARRVLQPNQLAKAEIAVDEAQRTFQATSGLTQMTENEAAEHLTALAPSQQSPDESYRTSVRVQNRANKAWNKIVELRKTDPAQAVSGGVISGGGTRSQISVGPNGELTVSPGGDDDIPNPAADEVQSAMELLRRRRPEVSLTQGEDGSIGVEVQQGQELSGRQAWRTIMEARLAAQQRLGVPDWQRRVITKAEGQKLLDMPDDASLNEREFTRRLKLAADRAEQMFGREYARPALEAALSFRRTSNERREEANGLIARLARNENIGRDDIERLGAIERIDRIGRLWEGPVGGGMSNIGDMREDRPAIMRDDAAISRNVERQAREAQRQPTDAQTQWLMQNLEERAPVFDRMFGRGAAARIVEGQR